MATVIAEIRLAPGEVGYYDDYSRIYLNSAKPTAKIYSDTNTVQIRRSIRSGRLRLISGSLNVAPPKAKEPVKQEAKPAKPEVKIEEKPAPEPEPVFVTGTVIGDAPETPATETTVAETAAEEVMEALAEEPVVKPKRRRNKKQTAEAE